MPRAHKMTEFERDVLYWSIRNPACLYKVIRAGPAMVTVEARKRDGSFLAGETYQIPTRHAARILVPMTTASGVD